MSGQYTKKPWQAVFTNNGGAHIIAPSADNAQIALLAAPTLNNRITEMEMRANALLGAAGPELFEALEEMISAFWGDAKEPHRASFRKQFPDHAIVRAERAIAKAKGERYE